MSFNPIFSCSTTNFHSARPETHSSNVRRPSRMNGYFAITSLAKFRSVPPERGFDIIRLRALRCCRLRGISSKASRIFPLRSGSARSKSGNHSSQFLCVAHPQAARSSCSMIEVDDGKLARSQNSEIVRILSNPFSEWRGCVGIASNTWMSENTNVAIPLFLSLKSSLRVGSMDS